MPNLSDIQSAAHLSPLLGRVTAALQAVCANVLATATDPNDAKLAWVKAAWMTGDAPRLQWWGARCLEYALNTSAPLQAALTANKDDPAVTDQQIVSFVGAYVQRCVDLGIK